MKSFIKSLSDLLFPKKYYSAWTIQQKCERQYQQQVNKAYINRRLSHINLNSKILNNN